VLDRHVRILYEFMFFYIYNVIYYYGLPDRGKAVLRIVCLPQIVSSLSPPLLARLRLFLGFVQTLAYDVDASTQAQSEAHF
jgi:hypothetical protein